ncbi:hypothetical protein N0V90_012101 [Kalmusia sp. IMI 367209]|nr:hypothetical protein N0V90_012101 [Kalmusia sp. IMI 367209]
MRHLYNAKPKNDAVIDQAKNRFERRRCNHHELENPLSDKDCLSAVVDPKDTLTNKHRYVVASQDPELRAKFRNVAGVPLIYISKSVMIMEPMASATEDQRDREERNKFRAGLKGQRNLDQTPTQKRKRDDEEGADGDDIEGSSMGDSRPQKKKKKRKGPKEPNPLSMKKAKKAQEVPEGSVTKPRSSDSKPSRPVAADATDDTVPDGEGSGHRKRKRKHKPKGEDSTVDGEAAPV